MAGFIRSVRIAPPAGDAARHHPYDVRAIADIVEDGLDLHPSVTFLVGGNGSGKSTLVEAIAVSAGLNAEGGGRNFRFTTHAATSTLADAVTLVRGATRPRTDFFLRAESFFNVASRVSELGVGRGYGDRGLHEQSHGESFLALALHRFGPDGLYVLDEPEAALSPQGALAFLRRMHELVGQGCQLVVATHSPLLMAYPDALVLELDDRGIRPVPYAETETFRLFADFTANPDAYLRHLLAD